MILLARWAGSGSLIIGSLLTCLAINELLVSETVVVGALYVIPILLAAMMWPPRAITLTAGTSAAVYVTFATLSGQPGDVRIVTVSALATIGVLAFLLARQRASTAARTREAEAALRARDEFLSVAAHELRTPVTSLRGFAQLATHQLRAPEQLDPALARQTLMALDRQSARLTMLVARLLEVSRLDTGRLTLQREAADLVGIAAGVVEAACARTARHTLRLEAPDRLIAEVDPVRVEQVLTNLVDNAIKFSPDGGVIHVSVRMVPPDRAEIQVRDHGVGIPPNRRAGLFERYYRAHADDHASGMGLGLYISHELVRHHGGELRAGFPDEGGTRFVVSLPLSTPTSNAAVVKDAAS